MNRNLQAEEPSKPCETEEIEQAEVACEECGRFGAYEIGGFFLCMDCYQGKGSCCQESNDSQQRDE